MNQRDAAEGSATRFSMRKRAWAQFLSGAKLEPTQDMELSSSAFPDLESNKDRPLPPPNLLLNADYGCSDLVLSDGVANSGFFATSNGFPWARRGAKVSGTALCIPWYFEYAGSTRSITPICRPTTQERIYRCRYPQSGSDGDSAEHFSPRRRIYTK
jgi:hypothetical protein